MSGKNYNIKIRVRFDLQYYWFPFSNLEKYSKRCENTKI